MALTWREVSAPDLSGAVQQVGNLGDTITRSFDNFSRGLDKFQQTRTEAADVAAMQAANQYSDPAKYAEALASGALLKDRGINPSHLSGKAAEYLAAHQRNLLGEQRANATAQLAQDQFGFTKQAHKENREDTQARDLSDTKYKDDNLAQQGSQFDRELALHAERDRRLAAAEAEASNQQKWRFENEKDAYARQVENAEVAKGAESILQEAARRGDTLSSTIQGLQKGGAPSEIIDAVLSKATGQGLTLAPEAPTTKGADWAPKGSSRATELAEIAESVAQNQIQGWGGVNPRVFAENALNKSEDRASFAKELKSRLGGLYDYEETEIVQGITDIQKRGQQEEGINLTVAQAAQLYEQSLQPETPYWALDAGYNFSAGGKEVRDLLKAVSTQQSLMKNIGENTVTGAREAAQRAEDQVNVAGEYAKSLEARERSGLAVSSDQKMAAMKAIRDAEAQRDEAFKNFSRYESQSTAKPKDKK